MNDVPYTTPDEDPFNIHPQPRRRRSSLLDKWIQEQQKPPDSTDDLLILDNYDIVDDDDIPPTPDSKQNPATPSTTHSRRTSKIISNPAPSFRTFKPFRSNVTPLPDDPGSSRSSKFSFLPRGPRLAVDANVVKGRSPSHQHNRSTSLGAFGFSVSGSTEMANITSSARSRPSILGHFASASASQASVPSDTAYTPSRPSISSGDTYISGSAITESDGPMTPSRMNFMDTFRFRTKSGGGVFASASAIFSSGSLSSKKAESSEHHNNVDTPDHNLPSTSTVTQRPQSTRIPLAQKPTSRLSNSNVDSDDDDDNTYHGAKQTIKHPDLTRPHVAYSSGGTLPRVNLTALSTRHKKKKRLVIRGVGIHDLRKFEGVKKWCEGFGEVSQIIRMPNGDLHVHFRLAEVADTVCRLRARVYIAGVGSVQLSWLTGDKR
ncbi:hypothetical protein H0H93_014195 [Arthromyces matolae]|nr:hypothetical protein H0H93_014195 [Arthromyces matolae]